MGLIIPGICRDRYLEIQYDFDAMVDIMEDQFGVLDHPDEDEFNAIYRFRLSDYGNFVPLKRYINKFRVYITCGISMDPLLAVAGLTGDEVHRLISSSITQDPFELLELWDNSRPYQKLNLAKIERWESQKRYPGFYPVIELYWPLLWVFSEKELYIQCAISPQKMAILLYKYREKNEIDLDFYSR